MATRENFGEDEKNTFGTHTPKIPFIGIISTTSERSQAVSTSFQQLIRRNRELIDLVTRTRNEKLDNVFVQTRMSNEG